MSESVSLTFPDGSVRSYDAGTTGRDVAESISKSLAKKAVAIAIDGTVRDLSDPVTTGKIEIITRNDERALELIRHDAAHVMAEAVQELWPGTQVTIGPVIENGFYYDFAKNEPFTPDDLPKIEKKMKEIIAAQHALHQAGLVAREGQGSLRRQGRAATRSNSSMRFRKARTSRSTIRATGSTFAAARIWPPPARSARPSS